MAKEGEPRTITLAQAQKIWEPIFRAEIVGGRDPRVKRDTPCVTVDEFITDYRERHCVAQKLNMDSTASRLDRIKKKLGTRPIEYLEDAAVIEDFISELVEKKRKVATINRYLALFRHMIGWGIGRGHLTRSPFYNKLTNPNGIHLRKGEVQRNRRLLEGEETALLTAADDLWQKNKVDHEYVARVMRARIEIAIDLGLRRGEMLKIEIQHIDWKSSPPILTIPATNAKSGKSRKVPIVSPRVEAWLTSRRFVGGGAGHPYGDERGAIIKSFQTAWDSILENVVAIPDNASLVRDLHWHDLRHECGSRLADARMDVRRIQELLGHGSLVTTQRYLNTDVKAVGEAMKKAMGWS